jgi:NAD(P)-dependent dehydrogenase (short-subunit alcohol dehydrogenase family)
MDPLSLHSRTALVTGAAGGIGASVARRLGVQGADLVLTDRTEVRGELDRLAEEIATQGRRVFVHTADVSSRDDVLAMTREARNAMGCIDTLVNVAGVHAFPTPLLTVDESQWNRVMSINLKGPLFLCQALVPRMIERQSGCVVNIASDSAFDAIADEGPYGISKMGLVRLSAYLARETAGTGVRVNSVAPGWVKTALSRPFWEDPAVAEGAIQGIPVRRFADPEDIANVVLFLVSGMASYINGHCLVADGGRIAGVPA